MRHAWYEVPQAIIQTVLTLLKGGQLQVLEFDLAALFLDPADERIGDGPGLLEDLLRA